MKKVLIGMSGGIDSSVAAALLKQQGFAVTGVFMNFWHDNSFVSDDPAKFPQNRCCSTESLEDARKVAGFLEIPFYTLNVIDEFKEKVVNPFIREYAAGKTPNPCIICNKEIKFGYLFRKMQELTGDYLATGHYCKSIENSNGKFELHQAADLKKDQSYFLYTLKEKLLKQILFPVGELEKTAVKKLAKKFKLPFQEKKESQEVCFIPDEKTGDFLKRHLKSNFKPGAIINTNGFVYKEKHQGLQYYTYGQRRGIEIGGPGGPYFVVDFDWDKNILYVGSKNELFSSSLEVTNLSFVNKKPTKDIKLAARIRHQAELVPCKLEITNDQATCQFKQPVYAVTPGQSVVFYAGSRVVGGGIITGKTQ